MKLNRTMLAALGLLAMSSAHATSFNCAIAHSTAETLICHDAGLSKADDELGKLFRLALKQTADRRAYRRDSDSKWTWREENCKDVACLTDWYSTRIGEIREHLRKPAPGEEQARPVDSDLAAVSKPSAKRKAFESQAFARDVQQCTATTQDLVPPVQCSSVLEKHAQWQTHGPATDGWFCGVAMIAPPPTDGGARKQAPNVLSESF
ncbi:hypothetical protein PPMP20_34050 [Paraburkholderia phymatum]|uniref:Lipoprotein n=1 Tax=Paraburkholderia phymatum (strain DSM 17167 / CIP 108236 / LMG 21445 / STM815) TaxID=391038 RepID=B2JMP3_PARP8|nr:hypothetical protein [Paraburkholderia phymatum]ACC72837.1 conserved hypothetical protein [Paraburkholderia phymatum STM815]